MRTVTFTRLIGTGAFGSVYLADLLGDRGFHRQVAVKVLHENHPNADLFMSRVRDEARLLGLLRDENVLEVLGLVGVAGRDAVLMEYVDGCDLSACLDGSTRPPPRALAEIGAAVAGALGRAHSAQHPTTGQPLGVIHRDVKPANLMITSRGRVKLLDFGVARARFEARESRTGQHVLGTLNYMAPEYIITGQVSPAADIYGLALTLWEAMTGEVFGQPRLAENLHKGRLNERLEHVVDTHEAFVPLLRRMLAWEPTARPSGAEVEAELGALAERLPGPSLRAWAAEVVPRVIAAKQPPTQADPLIGQTHPIEDPLGEVSAVFAKPERPVQPAPEPPKVDGAAPTLLLPTDEIQPALDPVPTVASGPPTPVEAVITRSEETGPPIPAQVVGFEGSPKAFPVVSPVVRRSAPAVGPRPAPSTLPTGSPTASVATAAPAVAAPNPHVPPPLGGAPPASTPPAAGSPATAKPAPAKPAPAKPAPPPAQPGAPSAKPVPPPAQPAPPASPPAPAASASPTPDPARRRRRAGPSLATLIGGAVLGMGLGLAVVVGLLVVLYLQR